MAAVTGSAAARHVGADGTGRSGGPSSLALANQEVVSSNLAWLGTWAAVILALTAAPYLVWLVWGAPDLERMGTFWFQRDFSQYLSAMRQGAESSSWLISNQFTAEPHQPILMYTLYVALGKLASTLGVGLLAAFYALEVVSRVALVGALYLFAATFARPANAKALRLTFLLAAFTLGFIGWLVPVRLFLYALHAQSLLDRLPATINVYLEINSFGVFLSAPHLMLGLALTLLAPWAYVRFIDRPCAGRASLLVGVILALSLVHSFNLPVLLSILGVHAVGLVWQRRAWVPLAAVGLSGLATAPILLYNLAIFQLDPFWSQTYGEQNLMPSPSPLSLPIDFGLVFVLAPLGILYLVRQGHLRNRHSHVASLLLVWCGLELAWMYVPVPFQRRFGLGLQPGLAALAALGIPYVYAVFSRWPAARRWVSHGLLALALTTTVILYIALLVSAARNEPTPVYAWTKAEARAVGWLAAHSGPEDVVLAATEPANSMVGLIQGRVVFGHIVATYHAKEKEALVQRFYSGWVPVQGLEQLLRQSGATFVFYGPHERAHGVTPLDEMPSLQLRYDQDGVRVYQVRQA